MNAAMRLRDFPFAFRLGLTGVVASLMLGVWASLEHLKDHHQNRDGRPGVSLDDLKGAYHGIDNPAPLVVALERNHPDGLKADDRAALLKWLKADKVSENYDNPDLGASAPAELIQRDCLSCHARKSTDKSGIGAKFPLDYWDDVQKLAFSHHLDATPEEILVTSTHTHALALGVVSIALGFLAWFTRFASALRSLPMFFTGVGLASDLAGWWLTRSSEEFIWLIVGGGASWTLGAVLSALFVLLELWLPKSRD